jgi:hypothetical protein
MTPSAAVKSRAEGTRRRLITLSSTERMELQDRRRERHAVPGGPTVATLVLLSYAAVRLR